VCFCNFVRLRISPPRIKLASSLLHCGSSTSQAGNLPFLLTLLPYKPQIGRISQRAGHAKDQHVWIEVSPHSRTCFYLLYLHFLNRIVYSVVVFFTNRVKIGAYGSLSEYIKFVAVRNDMSIGKVWRCRLLFVCFFVCTVTDFSAEDKASDDIFCTAVHRRPSQGISHFGELCSPTSPKSDESDSARATPTRM